MSRVAIFLFALFAFAFVAIASPVPSLNANVTLTDVEKRVTHVGRGTWFDVGLGNCGLWNVNTDPIVAIAKSRYDANGGANCNQWVEIVDTKNGKLAYALTRDSCESCGSEDLDMSPSLFQKFEPLSVGVLTISWHFMAQGWHP